MKAVDIAKKSVYPSVVQWSNEITDLMEKEISSSSALIQRERSKGKSVGETDIDLLLNFKPLLGTIFEIIIVIIIIITIIIVTIRSSRMVNMGLKARDDLHPSLRRPS